MHACACLLSSGLFSSAIHVTPPPHTHTHTHPPRSPPPPIPLTAFGNFNSSNPDGGYNPIRLTQSGAVRFTTNVGSAVVTSVTLRLLGFLPTEFMVVRIRNDAGTTPASSGSTVLATTISPTGGGDPVSNYVFPLVTPLAVTAGNTYWLTLELSGAGRVEWVLLNPTTAPASTPSGAVTFQSVYFMNNSTGTGSWAASSGLNTFSITAACPA